MDVVLYKVKVKIEKKKKEEKGIQNGTKEKVTGKTTNASKKTI